MLTCLMMDGQTHAIGKAIGPLFKDPVTFMLGIVTKLEISCSNCYTSIIIACQLALLYSGTFSGICLKVGDVVLYVTMTAS